MRKDGRRVIGIDGRTYFASRLAFLYLYGFLPKEVDHKNRNPSDNSKDNIRAASRAQNLANTKCKSYNKLQIKGVRKHWTGRYEAYISLNKKQVYLGGFSTPEEAHAAYISAAHKYYGEFARAA
jgi:hypothetical protein